MSRPGFPVQLADISPTQDGDLSTYHLHSDPDGSGLAMSLVVVAAGGEAKRQVRSGFDEVHYVLSGHGTLQTDESTTALSPEVGVLVNGSSDYVLRANQTALQVVVVSGPSDPEVSCGEPMGAVGVADQEKEPAVSRREYQILIDPARGCSGMTQFVGYVPAIRTPRHFHPYDEMLFVVRGHGTVEIEGHEVEVGPGSAYYLPAGCVHLVQNTQDEYLVELGIFTPAGSPTQNTPVE